VRRDRVFEIRMINIAAYLNFLLVLNILEGGFIYQFVIYRPPFLLGRHLGAEFQVGGQGHALQDGEQRLQSVVLLDVARLPPERGQHSRLPVHQHRPFHAGHSKMKCEGNVLVFICIF
jgi:hypothetical protein